jgi:hypothetical protein
MSVITAAAVVMSAAPGLAAGPEPELPEPESPWTKPTKVEAPVTPAGSTKASESKAESGISAEVAAWRAAQKARVTGQDDSASGSQGTAAAEATGFVPEGQGDVPWHQVIDTRLNDALVARVNVSNGNLMLAGTDFDIAGVGQKLQLTRTYNSLEAPWGKLSQRWWQAYERYLQLGDGEVVVCHGGCSAFPADVHRHLHHTGGLFEGPEEERGRHVHPDRPQVGFEGHLQRPRHPGEGHRQEQGHDHR